MLKHLFFASIIGIASFLPANAAWVHNLTVNHVFVGKYGTTQGRVYVAASNGRTYIVDFGQEWARGIMTAALTAQSTGRTISVNTTTAGPSTNEFFIDVLRTNPQ